jgi:hypothetical protein
MTGPSNVDSTALVARMARMTLAQHTRDGEVCEWCTAVQMRPVPWPCDPQSLAARVLVRQYTAMAEETGGRVAGGGSGPGCPLDQLPTGPLGIRVRGLPDGNWL